MNKVLCLLVFVFLAISGAGLYFELQLNDARAVLAKRNELQAKAIIKLARTFEIGKAPQGEDYEAMVDVSPIDPQYKEKPEEEDAFQHLDNGFNFDSKLEKALPETLKWGSKEEDTLKMLVTMEGPQMSINEDGTKLLEDLQKAANDQLARLNDTRACIAPLAKKIQDLAPMIKDAKREAREHLETIAEHEKTIETLQGEKATLEEQKGKLEGEIKDLNDEITSLKDEINTAKDETEMVKEDLEKSQKLIADLKKMLQEQSARSGGAAPSADTIINQLPAGDKGKIVDCDNEKMTVTIEFTDEAFKELKGDDLKKPLPHLELCIKRGTDQDIEFVTKIRLRQEYQQNLVSGEIIGAWVQNEVKIGDVVYAE